MNFLRRLALLEKKLDDSSRLDIVEIARVPDMLPRLFYSELSPYSLVGGYQCFAETYFLDLQGK